MVPPCSNDCESAYTTRSLQAVFVAIDGSTPIEAKAEIESIINAWEKHPYVFYNYDLQLYLDHVIMIW